MKNLSNILTLSVSSILFADITKPTSVSTSTIARPFLCGKTVSNVSVRYVCSIFNRFIGKRPRFVYFYLFEHWLIRYLIVRADAKRRL